MLSTVLELAGFVAFVVGAFLVAGLGLSLLCAGLVVMVVGYMIGEP